MSKIQIKLPTMSADTLENVCKPVLKIMSKNEKLPNYHFLSLYFDILHILMLMSQLGQPQLLTVQANNHFQVLGNF